MQFIPTTATTVQKIKSAAKAISRETGISHTKALEQEAKTRGYDGWFHVQQCQKAQTTQEATPKLIGREQTALDYLRFLAKQKRSPIEQHAPVGETFHDVTIEGQRFAAKVISTTGEVLLFKQLSGFKADFSPSVQLGAASVHKATAGGASSKINEIIQDLSNPGPHGDWWICKYGPHEKRIDLGGLTEQGRNALSFEFGLYLIEPGKPSEDTEPNMRFASGIEDLLFYSSPAYQALLTWAKSHTETARLSNDQSLYLQHWLDRAR